MKKRLALLACLHFASMTMFVDCAGPHDVSVEVSYDATASAPVLERLTVTSGADKSSWPVLTPSDRVRVILRPQGAPPRLAVVFSRAGKEQTWWGPELPVGAGYKIRVTIDANGKVTERH